MQDLPAAALRDRIGSEDAWGVDFRQIPLKTCPQERLRADF